MIDVNIASSYQYQIDIENCPLTFIAYDCTERNINTSCVFDILTAMYDIPEKNVEDLRKIVEKLKNANLEHTKSITIFSKHQSVTKAWIKLERTDTTKVNLIDMYIHYRPGDILIQGQMHGHSAQNQYQYGTFCNTHQTITESLIKKLNNTLCSCIFVMLTIISLMLWLMHFYYFRII